jgi:hypothetical protein
MNMLIGLRTNCRTKSGRDSIGILKNTSFNSEELTTLPSIPPLHIASKTSARVFCSRGNPLHGCRVPLQ